MEEDSFSTLGYFIVGGIAVAAIVFAVWQYVGKQWVETKFAEHIAKMSREYHAALTQLKLENDRLQAAKKLQELDYSVLPHTWDRLVKTHAAVKSLLRFGEYRIEVEHLNVSELGEIMSTMEWFQSEINRVKALDGYVRQDEFDNIRFTYQLKRVQGVFLEFDEFLNRNAIAYSPDLLGELKSLGEAMASAISVKEKLGARGKGENVEAVAAINEQFASRVSDLGNSIRMKLAAHELTA